MDSAWFKARLKERKLTQGHIADAIGKDRSVVSRLMSGEIPIKMAHVTPLAALLDVTPAEILIHAGVELGAPANAQGGPGLERVFVRGDVQAGIWKGAAEWAHEDWFGVEFPEDRRHPGCARFALEVKGTSMDEVYPDGTILCCILFSDLSRGPARGDRVIIHRRNKAGLVEATVKQFETRDDGSAWLWPRSTDPSFQQPYQLPGLQETADGAVNSDVGGTEAATGTTSFSDDTAHLEITALVIGSYRPE